MELREIDRIVAEKVMGWKLKKTNITDYWVGEHDGQKGDWAIAHMWKPTTDIRDAWAVVEKLKDKYTFSIYQVKDRYSASFESIYRTSHSGNHKNVSMAICLAALKAVGVEVEVDG